MEREHKPRVAAEDAEAQLARKNNELRRARNALQRELRSRTEDVFRLTQELIAGRQTLMAAKDELATELTAMTRLHELSTRLLVTTELQPLLEEVLDATIALLNADFGNVQFYDAATGALKIVAQRGFQQEFLDYFDSVQEGTASCGAALQRRERVIVEDVLTDPVFEPHLQIVAAAGYRAVQSTPLISRGGEMLGMISTHFRQPHRPSERELRFVDLYARQAAEMIERKQAEEALRKLNDRVEMILDSITDNFFAFSKDWRFTYFNKHAEKQLKALGKDAARLIGKVTWEEFQADPAVEEVFRRAMRERAVITHEHYYPPLGEWVENRIYPGPGGGVAVFQRYVTERKRAEDELRRSEAFLAEGQRISHTGSWSVKLPSEDVFWSQEVFRIYGLDPATTKLSQQMAFQLIHPEDRPFVKGAFERALRDKSDYTVEHRAILADGSIKHLHALGHPVLSESGDLVEYVGTVMDITGRKQAEELLRKAHERTEMILDSISDQFFALSSDGRFTYFNKHAAKQMQLLGKDSARLIGKVAWEEFPDMPNKENVERVLTERVAITDELYYAPLGEWVENHMYPSPDGGFVTFQRYVTERKRAEERLRRSEAYLAEAQSLSHTGSWGWIVASGKVVWSQETFRIFSVNPAEAEPSYDFVMQRVHPDDRRRVEQEVERAAGKNCDFRIEFRIVLPDGSSKHLEALGHPVKHDSGNSGEFLGAVMDVTERKRAEAALQKLQSELAHVTRVTTMGELAASIAHEINQPLGAISNNGNACLRLIADTPGSAQEVREVLTEIINDANRASAIIARIRALTKRTTPEKIPLQLKNVVADVLVLAQRELAERRIEVRTELPEDLPSVSGDRVQLQQVLLNLVMNGIEAMSAVKYERRVITICGQRDELDGNPAALITVQDLGAGFKPEDSERLFDAFYTTKPDGLGMGLRISRSIVEAHGGRLWATSGADPGAIFYCALPAPERGE